MPRNRYSWEEKPARRRKSSWWRWLLLFPVLAALAAGAIGAIVFFLVRAEFLQLAAQFDLERLEKMEAASTIYDRKGGLVGKIFIQNREPLPFEKIPEVLVQAVVATEDQKFWTHDGVDYQGMARAALANWSAGRIRQGASTVTQQLARNSFDLKERTYRRKLLEIALAHRIEERFPKEKIMELYLNRVYFGGGLYGAEAAARGYFGIPASALSAGQAAMLAGLLESPNSLSPWNNKKAAEQSRNYVLGQMRSMGFLSREGYQEALQAPLVVRQRPAPKKQSYAVEYIRQQAINSLGFDRAMNGGFRIYTTLDPAMQFEAEKALRRRLDEIERRPGYANQTYAGFAERFASEPPKPGDSNTRPPEYLQGAVLAVDNGSGGILAMVGGRDFLHSEYNRSVQGTRPLGTAFAPVLFAAAFEKGLYPGTVVQDWALDNRLVAFGGQAGVLGEWGVERADNEYEGEITAREALVRGKNSAVVRVGFQTGLDAVGQVAAASGIRSALRPYANTYLGSSELSLEEAVLAYTMFPGGGQRPAGTHIIDRIESAEGVLEYEYAPGRQKVISDSSAWQVHSLLTEVLTRGTGSGAMADYGLAVAGAAGKTGTAYNFTDAWFIGYSQAVTCGVWVGFDRPRQIYRGAFAKDLALPVWVDVMNASRADFPSAPMQQPLSVEKVKVCRISGELATDKCLETLRVPDGSEIIETTAYEEFVKVGAGPSLECPVHSSALKNYRKEFVEGEWPRPEMNVDTSKIPPVDVSSAPVVGGADPYNSVSPASMEMDGAVPVARAEAVVAAAGPPGGGSEMPADAGPSEVRAAEPVGVQDSIEADFSGVELAEPAPINF
ncbi:MAG: transglycosylase domain-containing protein [Chthoniobacterales bacterium]